MSFAAEMLLGLRRIGVRLDSIEKETINVACQKRDLLGADAVAALAQWSPTQAKAFVEIVIGVTSRGPLSAEGSAHVFATLYGGDGGGPNPRPRAYMVISYLSYVCGLLSLTIGDAAVHILEAQGRRGLSRNDRKMYREALTERHRIEAEVTHVLGRLAVQERQPPRFTLIQSARPAAEPRPRSARHYFSGGRRKAA